MTSKPKKNQASETLEISGLTLTKREYFAAMALQGLMANPNAQEIIGSNSYGFIALDAADQLIAQFEQYPEGW